MTAIAAAEAPPRSALANWALLGLLTLGVLISFVDRTSIGAAIADKGFVAQFHLSKVQSGWLSSLFFWSYGIAQLPMGWAVDRYGSKRPYALFFAGWCAITALTGLINVLMALFAARLLVGVAEAVVIPASYRWIRHNFDERNSGFAVGLFAMGNKFGPAIGTPVAAWLIVHHGWHAVFFAMAAVGTVWLLGWITLAPDDLPPPDVRAAIKRHGTGLTLGAALRNPVVLGSMITNFCYGYFTFYCMTWMPSYLVETRHLSLQTSGIYTFFSFAGIALMAAFGGWAPSRYRLSVSDGAHGPGDVPLLGIEDGGVIKGPALPNWQDEALLGILGESLRWRDTIVDFVIITPRYAGTSLADVRKGGGIVGVGRVLHGSDARQWQVVDPAQVEYWGAGVLSPA